MYLLIAYLSTCSDHDYWWVIKFAVIWTDWDGIYWWIYWLPNALSCYSLAYIGRTKMGLRELVCVGPKKTKCTWNSYTKGKVYTNLIFSDWAWDMCNSCLSVQISNFCHQQPASLLQQPTSSINRKKHHRTVRTELLSNKQHGKQHHQTAEHNNSDWEMLRSDIVPTFHLITRSFILAT